MELKRRLLIALHALGLSFNRTTMELKQGVGWWNTPNPKNF